jgi:hypothetical protein
MKASSSPPALPVTNADQEVSLPLDATGTRLTRRVHLLIEFTGDGEVGSVRGMRPSTYKIAVKCVSTLYRGERDRSLIEIMRLNYKDIEAFVTLLADHSINSAYLEAMASRVFPNYLSATRLRGHALERVVPTPEYQTGRSRAVAMVSPFSSSTLDRSTLKRWPRRYNRRFARRGLSFCPVVPGAICASRERRATILPA